MGADDSPAFATLGFDTSVAHPARIWDYFLGGKDNFTADRVAAQGVLEVLPAMAMVARAGRAFLAAAVHYLATDGGIGQFLDIGTGLPTANNTHEVAQRANELARIVYVDNDPIVLSHARALLTSGPDGETAYVDADIRDTDRVLAQAARTLDFTRPVAVMLLAVLHFVPDGDDPYKITAKLMDALPAGSFLALSHATSDIQTGRVAAGNRALQPAVRGPDHTPDPGPGDPVLRRPADHRPWRGAAGPVAPGAAPALRLTRPAHLLRGRPQALIPVRARLRHRGGLGGGGRGQQGPGLGAQQPTALAGERGQEGGIELAQQ